MRSRLCLVFLVAAAGTLIIALRPTEAQSPRTAPAEVRLRVPPGSYRTIVLVRGPESDTSELVIRIGADAFPVCLEAGTTLPLSFAEPLQLGDDAWVTWPNRSGRSLNAAWGTTERGFVRFERERAE